MNYWDSNITRQVLYNGADSAVYDFFYESTLGNLLRRGGCSESPCCSRQAGFAIYNSNVTGLKRHGWQ